MGRRYRHLVITFRGCNEHDRRPQTPGWGGPGAGTVAHRSAAARSERRGREVVQHCIAAGLATSSSEGETGHRAGRVSAAGTADGWPGLRHVRKETDYEHR